MGEGSIVRSTPLGKGDRVVCDYIDGTGRACHLPGVIDAVDGDYYWVNVGPVRLRMPKGSVLKEDSILNIDSDVAD